MLWQFKQDTSHLLACSVMVQLLHVLQHILLRQAAAGGRGRQNSVLLSWEISLHWSFYVWQILCQCQVSFVVKPSKAKTKGLLDIRYIVTLLNSLGGSNFLSAYEKKNGANGKTKGRCRHAFLAIFVYVRHCDWHLAQNTPSTIEAGVMKQNKEKLPAKKIPLAQKALLFVYFLLSVSFAVISIITQK